MNSVENAKYINNLRGVSRHVKNIIQNNKMKNRSKYQLTDKEDCVDSNTIVFESFGGKTIAIVLNIYMSICKKLSSAKLYLGILIPIKM